MALGTALCQRFETFAHREAMVSNEGIVLYLDLVDAVERWRRQLAADGVAEGAVVTVEGDYSASACALLLALQERRCVAVPLTSQSNTRREQFRAIARAEIAYSPAEGVSSGRRLQPAHAGDLALYVTLRERGSAGLVLFSSGSTGQPKAAVLDLERLIARHQEQRRAQRTLVFLMFDHIGGINTLIHVLSQGGTIVTAPDRSPDAVCAAIAAHRVQLLPTTPTFLNMALMSGALERHDLSSLEMVTYGTEPMPEGTLRRLHAALPKVTLKQTYGLSELGILPTKSRSPSELWLKLGGAGFEHKIVDGILWIKSEMAMLGYINAPSPFDAEGWFNTQDAVEVDGEYIRILGRKSELINVGGEKVYPTEVEDVILEVSNIADASVRGRANHVTGMVVEAQVALKVPEESVAVGKRVREHCKKRLASYKVPVRVEVVDGPLHSERFKKARLAP
jgi:acyl-CoA synthetase (AMP-forming)/AMP-acid ligase II